MLGTSREFARPYEQSEKQARMSRRKKCIIALSGILLAGAALALVLWRRADSGPALLRILPPQADLYALVDFADLQRNPAVRRFLSDPPEFSVADDYRGFVEASGFRYQDDLRQLALARVGSSYVGAARIAVDRSRMLQYLETETSEGTEGTEGTERTERTEETETTVETETTEKTEVLGNTVFTFGRLRPFRLALPEPNLAVFTIGEDNALIEKALARLAQVPQSDSAASELAAAGELPRLSQGNALALIMRTERIFNQGSVEPGSGPFRFGGPLLRGSKALYITVESGLTQLDFEVENLCEDEPAAQRFARMIQSLLVLLRAAPVEGSDPLQGKLAVLLQDVAVQQVSDSVLMHWKWDAETFRRLE